MPIAQGDKNSDSTATSAISGAPNNRKRHEHRYEKRQRQQYREVVEGGKGKQRDYTLGEHFSDRCLPEKADELCRQRYREQCREHREREIAEFTQQGAVKDHFVNGWKSAKQIGSKAEKRRVAFDFGEAKQG